MNILRVLPAVAATAVLAADPSSTADTTRETLAKWMETQQILSKEKRDWQTGKDVLEQRIELLKSEIAANEKKIAEVRSSMSEADEKRYEVVDKNNRLKADTAAYLEALPEAEAKTRRLVAVLPEPLRAKLEPLTSRIPAEGARTELSVSQRWQNVVGILNEVNKFDRDVTVASELRTLPDGRKAEVQTVYLGLAQAYYVTSSGDAAGIGRPGEDGWSWTPANELAPKVAQVVAILKNEHVPAFVPLPVEVR